MFSMALIALLGLFASLALAQETTFYAFGKGMKGAPLFYSDGIAYLGDRVPEGAKLTTNITLVANTEESSIVATPVDEIPDWDSPKLYINNNAGAFDEAGFEATPGEGTTSDGFRIFGSMLVWTSEDGDIVTKWYAEPIGEDLCVLKWNVDNVSQDPEKSFPVVMKNRRGGPPGRRH